MTKPAAERLAILDDLGFPSEPINTLPEVMALDRLARCGMLETVEYPPGSGRAIGTAGLSWQQIARDGPVRRPSGLGRHVKGALHERSGE
jgi:crotonobetainyl-CoA:carnitine CoA-transferase CaiB-like acyl-CoA transferase